MHRPDRPGGSEVNHEGLTEPETRPERRPTQEQQEVIDFAQTGRSFSVRALAGTGKTTTLASVAEKRPEKSLYLAFNKSIAREAEAKFPPHVTVKTGHALAYPFIGRELQKQGRLEMSDFAIRAAMVRDFGEQLASISGPGRDKIQANAYAVFDTVKNYMNSASKTVGLEHVPEDHAKLYTGVGIARVAQAVFNEMTNVQPGHTFPSNHDAYLKAFTNTDPKLPFKVIYGDEWQDTNPNMQALIDRQTHAQRIYVGDRSQAIYGFRGAVDALAQLDDLPKFPLTQSFRFGPQVAEVANAILAVKNEELQVKGLAAIDDRLLPVSVPDALLARTNAGLFESAFGMLPLLEPTDRIAFVGGVREVIAMVTAAYELSESGTTAHKDFRFFKSWDELREVVKEGQAPEYAPFVRLVETHGSNIPEMCETLAAAAVEDESRARVVFSTAHKSKGREWEVVGVAADFAEFCKYDEARNKFSLYVEEANLAYVTMTRAKLVLDDSAYRPILMESIENRQNMLERQLAAGMTADVPWNSERVREQRELIEKVAEARENLGAAWDREVRRLSDVAIADAIESAGTVGTRPAGAEYDPQTVVGSIVASALAGPYRALVEHAADANQIADVVRPDMDALQERIESTDWEAGPDATRETLAAITAAVVIEPIETENLIDRFAASNAEDDPAIVAMKAAVTRGIEQRLDALMATPVGSDLRIFEPIPNEPISDRTAKKMVLNQTITVMERSEDGKTIFGRKDGIKGSGVIAVSREAFDNEPKAGEVVTLKRSAGRDFAEPVMSELVLEQGA